MSDTAAASRTPAARAIRPELDEIDIAELFGVVLNYKWRILATTLLAGVIAAVYALSITPVYRVDALLQVEKKEGGIPGMAEISEALAPESKSSTEIEILRSRQMLGAAVEQAGLRLTVQPRYLPVLGGWWARRHGEGSLAEPLFGLDGYAWGGERVQVTRFDPGMEATRAPWTLVAGEPGQYTLLDDDGREVLRGRVGETAVGEHHGAPVSLFVAELSARPGTPFALTLASAPGAIAALSASLSAMEQGKDTGILRLTHEGTDPARIVTALNALANTYVRQNVELKSQEAEQMLVFLEQQIPEVKGRLDAAEMALNDYRQTKGTVDLTQETTSALDQVTSLEKEISALELKRTELAQKFTANHPAMASLQQQLGQLSSQKASLEAQFEKLPETQLEYLRLTRDITVANELYVMLLNKMQELRVVKAGTTGNVRIIDAAIPPQAPFKPRKAMIVTAGLVLGLLLGIAWVLLARLLHRGVEDPDVIERDTGLPVYASIVHSQAQSQLSRIIQRRKGVAGEKLLALESPDDPAIEAMRSLRTSLQFALMDSPNNLIAISGPAPGIGKSFLSANFAAVLAGTGKRVLLIDGDLRKGHLHKHFGQPRGQGLSELIAGTVPLEQAVRVTGVSKLSFIPTGQLPPNPAELLMSQAFDELMARLQGHYDLVLIDTPPILAVTDAAIIARKAGVLFLTLRAAQHPMREIQAMLRRLDTAGIQPTGFILNDLALTSSKYGQYGYYNYQYSYK